jgi:hypothetical protein
VSNNTKKEQRNVDYVGNALKLVKDRPGRRPVAVSVRCIECGATHYMLLPPQGEVLEETMKHDASCSLDMQKIMRVFHYSLGPNGSGR